MKLTGNTIKTELQKSLGISRKHLSVSCKRSSINVEIKSWEVSTKAVEDYLSKYEKIDRCEYSGEILCGANTFVFVRYDWDLEIPSAIKAKYKEISSWNKDCNLINAADISDLKEIFGELKHLHCDDLKELLLKTHRESR